MDNARPIASSDPYTVVSVARDVGALDYSDRLEVDFLGLDTPSAETQEALRQAGVPNSVLGSIAGPREALVVFYDAHRFDLTEDGEEGAETALILAVRDVRERVVDLAAFKLTAPAMISTWEGHAAFLGQGLIDNPAATRYGPLRAFPDALAWLRAAGDGVVVIDPGRAWRLLLDHGTPLEATDHAHARRLRNQLAPPRNAVRVLVRRREAA